ncbi:MAG TPA: class I SAM-dependent methyltransferase [Candidatus Limnocylindria bacterium]|nr:class I SAM-dependent methyltransferase [Candidatus Limnocylindria bacterium]
MTQADGSAASGTWHYGLVARWWAEFNSPTDAELAYLRDAIERHGQPALDLGCGTGRLLLPLLAAGFDVDGADVSSDMLAHARSAARRAGFSPTLLAQATHELDLPRSYKVIFSVGTFGLGGNRENEREGIQRALRHLAPGGALLLNHELPYAGLTEQQWALWLSDHRARALPRDWPETGNRKRTADGDEIELTTRTVELDPLGQRLTLDMRARLWRDGVVVEEETHRLHISLYFAQEIVGLLREAGFEDVRIESGYTGRPATADDTEVMLVARRPG